MNFNAIKQAARQVSQRASGVGRTRGGLGITSFTDNGREFVAVEQNPIKMSRWADLKNQGHDVTQIIDNTTKKFVAVVVDDVVTVYNGKRR